MLNIKKNGLAIHPVIYKNVNNRYPSGLIDSAEC